MSSRFRSPNATRMLLLVVASLAALACSHADEPKPASTPSTPAAPSTAASTPGAAVFHDPQQRFSFEYPQAFTVSGAQPAPSQDWRAEATQTGTVLAQLVLPASLEPHTNFSEAKLTIGASADPTAVSNCLTDAQGGDGAQSAHQAIGGLGFTKLVFGDAGAGNFYDTTSYRIVHEQQCYSIEYTIHSTNIGAYDPSQGVHEFQRDKVTRVLEGMIKSFKFGAASTH